MLIYMDIETHVVTHVIKFIVSHKVTNMIRLLTS